MTGRQHKPAFEKLVPPVGESFRCFDRSRIRSRAKWHRHPEIELTYVHSGSGTRLVGDSIGSYGDADLVLLGPELPHTWLSDAYRGKAYDRHPAIVVQFHPEFLGAEFFGAGEMTLIHEMLEKANRGLQFPEKVARSVGERMTSMVELRGASRLIQLMACLDELSACRTFNYLASESYSTSSNAETETRIQTICDHITSHVSDPNLNHRELADLACMNPSAFSRFFKQSTGRTTTDYIAELRVGMACRLLTATEESILSISVQSGFNNLSNFNRRFRQHRNLTPREYRAKFRAVS